MTNIAIRLTPIEVIPEPHYGPYCIRFVRPYLGGMVYDFLTILQDYAGQGRNPTIKEIVEVMGHGTQHTIVGRGPVSGKPAQEGLIDKAVQAGLLVHRTHGHGRQLAHIFDVVNRFPTLTPAQVCALSRERQERHYLFVRGVQKEVASFNQLFVPVGVRP